MSKPVERIKEIVNNYKKLYLEGEYIYRNIKNTRWICLFEENTHPEYFHVIHSDSHSDYGREIKGVLARNNVPAKTQAIIKSRLCEMVEGPRNPKYICITHDYKVYSTQFLRS